MKRLLPILIATLFITYSFAQDTKPEPGFGSTGKPTETDKTKDKDTKNNGGDGKEVDDDDDAEIGDKLSALLQYNFSGGNKGLGNLTPVIDYGFSTNLIGGEEENNFHWDLSINPYAAGQINIKDSTAFIPALMLPGAGGVRINHIFRWKVGKRLELGVSPANSAYKLMTSFSDSVTVIAQHNIRTGFAVKLEDLFILGLQHTWGWHNSTSQSEEAFEKTFKRHATDISYFTLTLQTKLPKQKNSYFYAEWRALTNASKYENYTNTKIISFGVRIGLSFENANPGAAADGGDSGNKNARNPWTTTF
ncbi:MAG: hypothetical protein DI538_15840 [Azospira oryzae]|jgi:hypothetical protein|nr:MAG: hypothetical protein DI538_15840 [Azospira oryzae]